MLSEILSECRKYGLHLIFAHQSWAQLSSYSRLSGALEQAQVKAIFGSGRQTAQALASSLYLPDPAQIKHEVADPDQQGRTHPLFENVLNQLEMAVQEIMRLRRRRILVKLPESDTLLRLRTPTLPRARINRAQLQAIQRTLVGTSGQMKGQGQNRTGPITRADQSSIGQDRKPGIEEAWRKTLWKHGDRSVQPAQVVFQA